MQQEQHALNWFMHKVKTGVIDPTNPDFSLVPNDVMADMHWERSPDGEFLPTQIAVNVTLFLFIASKIAHQINQGTISGVVANQTELFIAVQRLLLLARLETFKRSGVLKYRIKGTWHDGQARISISDFKPQPLAIEILPMLKTYFTFN